MATYYVDTAVGDDANAGTAEGAGNAWATIDKAMNTVGDSDHVYIKASGNYNETATLDTAATAQTATITFEGYTSTPGDNGKCTIDGQSVRTTCLTTGLATNVYYVFKNIIFQNATSHAVNMPGNDRMHFHNCEAINNGGFGFYVDNGVVFVNCVATGNGNANFAAGTQTKLLGCISGNATNDGADCDGVYQCHKSVFYGIPASRQGLDAAACLSVTCSTFDCEGNSNTTAIMNLSEQRGLVTDCIIYDANNGIDVSGAAVPHETFYGYNLYNSNANYDHEFDLGSLGDTFDFVKYQSVTSAPAFTDEANDDYTLDSASPAIDAGMTPGGIT